MHYFRDLIYTMGTVCLHNLSQKKCFLLKFNKNNVLYAHVTKK